MPATVMDNESYTLETREDDSPQESRLSSLGLSRVTSAPDPIRPGFFLSVEARSATTKSPAALRNLQLPTDSHTSGTRWTTAGSTRLDPLAERPEKRPRLDPEPDTGPGRTFKRGHPPETSSPVVGPKTSRLLSTVSPRSSDVSEHDQESQSPCFNCWGSEDMVNSIVKGVLDLQLEISRALPIKPPQKPHESLLHDVTKQGLKHSLEWTLNELRATLQTMHGVSATARPGLPSLADVVPKRNLAEVRRPSLPGQTSILATPSSEERPLPLLTDSGRPNEYTRKLSDHAKDQYMSSYDSSLPPILIPDEMQRVHGYDHNPRGSAQSPHLPGGSGFGPQSPNQTQRSNRTLPSPPSAQYPSPGFSGSSQFSAATVQAAHASHLQDLQHQISTKTLALQTLQREHDQLLAAFSRSQIRCNTLDKKSQVSDHEINTLTEEKIRLQQQVESLEANVEELAKSRDEVHQQSSADGAQWRQIMAMSSQLQIKGAEEARRHKADREAWEEDRAILQQRVRDLEAGSASASNVQQTASDAEFEGDPLSSMSTDVMRHEIIRLRRKCADMEKLLQDLSGETEQIDNAINAMASIRQRIAIRKQQDETR